MKKLYLLALAFTVVFAGCSPEDEDPESSKPRSFTQKALLEYFSGAWCGYCPEGRDYAETLKAAAESGSFEYVVYHYQDQMDVIYDDPINTTFNKIGYPTGMVNRISGTSKSRSAWQGDVNAVYSEKAKCGLAVNATSKSGSTLNVNVKLAIAGEDMPAGKYFMTVLLVEEEMTGTGQGWDQVNYYNNVAGHAYQGKGDPILGYVHTNTVRYVLNQEGPLGDPIGEGALKANTETSYTFSVDLGNFPAAEDLNIIAFLHEYTYNVAQDKVVSSYLYNMQKAKVGTNQDFD